MATMDRYVLLRCPACGALVPVSGDCAALFERVEGGGPSDPPEWVPAVLTALCGCWAKALSPQRALHLYLGILAA